MDATDAMKLQRHLGFFSGALPQSPAVDTSPESVDDQTKPSLASSIVEQATSSLSNSKTSSSCTANNKKTGLLSLPTEILTMILEILLVRNETSIALPIINHYRFPDLKPDVSLEVVQTCKRLNGIGKPLFYGHNIFNLEPHIRQYASWTPAFTPLNQNSLALIEHLEVCVDDLGVHHFPPHGGAIYVVLSKALRLYPYPYPGGGMGNVQSIQCVFENSFETQMLVLTHSDKGGELRKLALERVLSLVVSHTPQGTDMLTLVANCMTAWSRGMLC